MGSIYEGVAPKGGRNHHRSSLRPEIAQITAQSAGSELC